MKKFKYFTTDGSTYKLLQRNAKSNRRYATEAESVLWECLRRNALGARFRRQHPVCGYIPDFVCLTRKLIIEVDGGYHNTQTQIILDKERDAFLQQNGYRILRFTNEEVLMDIDNVLGQIKNMMNKENNMDVREGTPLLGRGRGRLFIVSAPSGSGKSTIVQWLMKEHPELNLYFSISCTSRPPRGTEQHGVEYFFLTEEEFRQRIDNNEFLEYEEVYAGRFYGTLKQQVEKQLEAGQNVIFDVDVKGGVNIKKYYGDRAMSLFIQPPSVEELRRRLEGRGTDSPEAIESRLAKAEYEMTFASQFDHVVVNDDLETAKQETLQLVQQFLNSNK